MNIIVDLEKMIETDVSTINALNTSADMDAKKAHVGLIKTELGLVNENMNVLVDECKIDQIKNDIKNSDKKLDLAKKEFEHKKEIDKLTLENSINNDKEKLELAKKEFEHKQEIDKLTLENNIKIEELKAKKEIEIAKIKIKSDELKENQRKREQRIELIKTCCEIGIGVAGLAISTYLGMKSLTAQYIDHCLVPSEIKELNKLVYKKIK